MYARLNYVDLRPALMTELKAFWAERVGAYKGLLKGYLLLEGNTGHSLSVVFFDTEAAMVENANATLKGVAKDAAKYRLTEPEVHLREVMAEVAGNPGPIGYARVADVTMKVERLGDVVRGWPGHVATYKPERGFRGATFCGDAKTGRLASISFWGSKADCEANEKSGAFQATVDPYKDMIAIPPKRSYWDVVVVVGK
jgi:heme-degrading monooxygenase HmoA